MSLMRCVSLLLLALPARGDAWRAVDDPPTQIHISHAPYKGGYQMQIVWATKAMRGGNKVYLKRAGAKGMGKPYNADSTNYNFSSPLYDWWVYQSPYLHTAIVGPLSPNAQYEYQCGSDIGGYSKWIRFTTQPGQILGTKQAIAIVGDTGYGKKQLQVFKDILNDPTITSSLILGDFCYADAQKGPERANPSGPGIWDIYFEGMEPVFSTIPMMPVTGNHDPESNDGPATAFTAYKARLSVMDTKQANRLYYSYNHGRIHFIVLDNYVNSPVNGDDLKGVDTAILPGTPQYVFLEKDLKSVNRTLFPWVVVAVHSPYYHTNNKHRFGTEGVGEFFGAIEDLMFQYHVDLVVAGHVHNYERTLQVYKGEVNPDGPVYILVGTGGNTGNAHTSWNNTETWSAFRNDQTTIANSTWGYGRLEYVSDTQLHWMFKTWSEAPVHIEDHAMIMKNMPM